VENQLTTGMLLLAGIGAKYLAPKTGRHGHV
jgi:hypothetical protein